LSRKLGLHLGFRTPPAFVVAAVGNGEGETTSNSDDVQESNAVAPERVIEENGSFPVESQENLIIHRRDPPNVLLYAAGFCLIVLMRNEFASRGINFGSVALLLTEGIVIGLGKLTNVLAEPIAFLLSVISWAIMAVTDIYTLIVDAAPVRSLLNSLVLSLAVLSIGDATTCKVQGSRSRLVGVATGVGLLGVFEMIPPEAVLLCLTLLTAFAKLVQKADVVTVFMPAAVTLVAIGDPVLRVVAFAAFVLLCLYANWRFGEEIEGEKSKRVSIVFSIMSASILISWASRLLYFRSLKWLVLRSTF
jgi:hypothetical protein